jgi:hypothetical protein
MQDRCRGKEMGKKVGRGYGEEMEGWKVGNRKIFLAYQFGKIVFFHDNATK